MSLVHLNFPIQPQTLAHSTAVYMAFQTMRTAEPFDVNDKVSDQGNPDFLELEDLQARYWLTSTAIRYGDLEFEFKECIISINQEKNIVSTALQGRDGTIKEYISDGDYAITLDAAVINKDGTMQYPIEDLRKLKKLLKIKDALEIQSDLLEVFGIRSAVVSSYFLTQETHSNRQSIQIQLLSDEPYEIKLKDKDYVTVS